MLNFVHFIKHLRHTGAVAPSSEFLCREMVRSLNLCNRKDNKPLRILELGPGTGVITKEIVKCLRTGDHFDTVELDPGFYEEIRDQYASENVHVHGMNFLNFDPDAEYDYIISSLPYDMIPLAITEEIWKKKLQLCKFGSEITYYKYYKFNIIRSPFERGVNRRYLSSEKLIWKNVPPAKVYTLKIKGTNS